MSVEDVVAAASAVRSEYTQSVEGVRGDDQLSDLAKSQRLAELHSSTAARLKEIEDSSDEADANLQGRHEHVVFSPGRLSGADAISYRDALDRAEMAKDADSKMSLLHRAIRTGDEHLERAVMSTALERRLNDPIGGDHWNDILDVYAERHPGEVPAINAIIEAKQNRRRFAENRVARDMLFRVPKPAEIGGR